MSNTSPDKRYILEPLRKQLDSERICEQVLLSFAGDPYCHLDVELKYTRHVLRLLRAYRVPVAILTKGGHRALRDIDILSNYNAPVKVGATLTFIRKLDSLYWEPNAATPDERLDMLRKMHDAGIRTWVSLEPVIDPQQTLEIIDATSEFVDEYKIGKLNYVPTVERRINWTEFVDAAVEKLRSLNKPFYVKADLAKYATVKLTVRETDMDALTLKVTC